MLLYSLTSVPPAVTTLIATYVCPYRAGSFSANFNGLIAWSNADAEYWVYRNGILLVGGRTSGAEPTLQLSWPGSPIGLVGNDIILIYASHAEVTPILLNCSLIIDLV
jgi:hypothetical protein